MRGSVLSKLNNGLAYNRSITNLDQMVIYVLAKLGLPHYMLRMNYKAMKQSYTAYLDGRVAP